MTRVSLTRAGGELAACDGPAAAERTAWSPPAGWAHNDLLYGWGYITALCLGRRFRDPDLTIATLYIEFENVAAPGDTVAAPTVTRDAGITYYTGLAASATKDYLRVPVIADPTLDVLPGYEGRFSAGQGNRLTFQAVTSGAAGVHGKPFAAGSNSVVYGAALVATPDFADPTQDVVWSRGYLAPTQQVAKTARAVSMFYRAYFV